MLFYFTHLNRKAPLQIIKRSKIEGENFQGLSWEGTMVERHNILFSILEDFTSFRSTIS